MFRYYRFGLPFAALCTVVALANCSQPTYKLTVQPDPAPSGMLRLLIANVGKGTYPGGTLRIDGTIGGKAVHDTVNVKALNPGDGTSGPFYSIKDYSGVHASAGKPISDIANIAVTEIGKRTRSLIKADNATPLVIETGFGVDVDCGVKPGGCPSSPP
jgi:hypothetical protein